MNRLFSLLYGITAYLLFFGAFIYAIGFVGNLGVPKSIDGTTTLPLHIAFLIDAGLLLLFAVQHKITERMAFRNLWSRCIPEHLERSTWVLLSALYLVVFMWLWQPVDGLVWVITDTIVHDLLFVSFLTGWFTVLLSTFLINHFELFGLRQLWLYYQNQPYEPISLKIPMFYRYIRHPVYFGFLVAIWSTPVMTGAHLAFACMSTCYILIELLFGDMDPRKDFSRKYGRIKKSEASMVPFISKTNQSPGITTGSKTPERN